ncbi:hypothetical protein [Guptibacillus algicola]|uniref:hypothetical protein n=1 Tax=Guptibacillus algicola TaxID=225844 RepID=UPI001CD7794A|nr:hypothetical protein [Alkalihalobacillus algicola]MCA0987205.1 hypothetical protein [Alkalihalobacillus algicola]
MDDVKYLIGFSFIVGLVALSISFMIITTSYFHSKEIALLTSKCNDVNGEVMLELHNYFTNSYSFECKK